MRPRPGCLAAPDRPTSAVMDNDAAIIIETMERVVERVGDPMPLIDCKLDGDKISFAVKVDMGGNAATFSSKGTVKGDEITLTMTNDAGMDFGGEMKLKKQAK